MTDGTKNLLSENNLNRMLEYCDKMPGHKILVVGDIMVDEYIWGAVQRISPEAPVPVVRVKNETTKLGGAANVVNNLRALYSEVKIAGVIGMDSLGHRVISALNRINVNPDGVVQTEMYQTILKTRIIAHNQQVVRVDRESIQPISGDAEDTIIEYCLEQIKHVDGVLLSDYGKGVLTEKVSQAIINHAKMLGKICAVDPKVKSIMNYTNATVVTPNHHEAMEITGYTMDEDHAIEKAGKKLFELLNPESVLITCGEQGMALFEKNRDMEIIDTVAQDVYDVTGAGDTVISALTLALAAGVPLKSAAVLANFAAGVVVGKVGTATASVLEMKKALKRYVS